MNVDRTNERMKKNNAWSTGTGFGKPGKPTKNGYFIQWANREIFKVRHGFLRLSSQNTWQIFRLASSWLSLQSNPKEGFLVHNSQCVAYVPGLWSQTVWAQLLTSWVVLDESFNFITPQFYLLKNGYNNSTKIIELWELNMITCMKQLAWCFKYSEWSLHVSSLYHGTHLGATVTSAKSWLLWIFQADQHQYTLVPDPNHTKWLLGIFIIAPKYWAAAYLQVVCRGCSYTGAIPVNPET